LQVQEKNLPMLCLGIETDRMRLYGQFCPIARGSEILAERWTPIILRNILLGCSTFNEIAAGAPGLSRALLTRRLRELERAGVIEIHPKPDGHGSLYEPTAAGRDLSGVLQALGGWAERWMEVTSEHSDPDVILWSWCSNFLRNKLLPERRVVVRFEFKNGRRKVKLWLLIENREAEICRFDPGFGDDVVVTINDPLSFARWHLGLVTWGSALRTGAIEVSGARELRRMLPTWNGGPEEHATRRAARGMPEVSPLPLSLESTRRVGYDTSPLDGGFRQVIRDFEGTLITPDDPEYDRARAVWNGAIDRRPRYIARCLSSADVAAALAFGRGRDLQMSVRAGGHGVAGAAVCDGGLVIDLRAMKSITVDPVNMTATVGAGVVWGELDAATQAFGLATTGGTMSETGVSGLTLGGGLGWLMRRYGLTVDNLAAADVVTADGEALTASERDHPDLFWGLRGGGGGLGIATSFTFRLHRVGPEVLCGAVIWPLEDAPEVLRAYREFISSAPPEVATLVALRRAPALPFLPIELHGRPVCIVGMLALAEPGQAERLIGTLRSFGRPLLDLVTRRPYTALQSMFDAGNRWGWHYYWKSLGVRSLDEEVIDKMVEHAGRIESPWSYVVMFHLGGAVAELDPHATAYSRRDIDHEININAVWLPGEPIGDGECAWVKAFFSDLQPTAAGAYLNFLDRDDQARTSEAFSAAAYARLVQLRHRFDPDEVLQPSRLSAPV
jgi:FAD/FMN-containing dehydrogenase/DNA-binding HxlR family transcriptional regulator